jgi:hypothetical protein
MLIYRIDGKEQMDNPLPDGANPRLFLHKVEYLDTTHDSPTWIVICDNLPKFDQKLATNLHDRFCSNHGYSNAGKDCSWGNSSWDDLQLGIKRQSYLDKAKSMMIAIREISDKPLSDENAYNAAIHIIRGL